MIASWFGVCAIGRFYYIKPPYEAGVAGTKLPAMADSSKVTLTYHGAPAFVVETQGLLNDGDEIEVEKDVAARLLRAHGFSGGPKGIQPEEPAPPPDPTGLRLEDLVAAQEDPGPADVEPDDGDEK
jgi:hypothetical protein